MAWFLHQPKQQFKSQDGDHEILRNFFVCLYKQIIWKVTIVGKKGILGMLNENNNKFYKAFIHEQVPAIAKMKIHRKQVENTKFYCLH